MSTSNAIERKIKIQSILEDMPTEHSIKHSIGKTLLETGLSVVVGGTIAAVIGKPSFYLGILTTSIANYSGYKILVPVGIGMTATSLCVEGDTAKDRFKNLGNSLISRSYADKLVEKIKGIASSKHESTNGIGEVDHDRSLEEIEKQLISTAMDYQHQSRQSANRASAVNMEGFDEADTSAF